MLRGLEAHEIEVAASQIVNGVEGDGDPESMERGVIEVAGDFTDVDFVSLKPSSDPVRMLAVDGGSAALLHGGSFVVAGVRVGHAAFDDRDYSRADSDQEVHVFHLSLSSLKTAYSIFFGKTVGGEAPDCPRGLEEGVGRIRTLMEWKRIEDLLKPTNSGSVVAFDGALWAGIKGMDLILKRIVARAEENGILLCAISKRSMLTHRGVPLIPEVQMRGEEFLPSEAWFLPVEIESRYKSKMFGRVHVAKLHKRAKHAFRVDIAGSTPTEDVFDRLARLSDDPAYVGYPYPLARVHNDVAFSGSEVEEMRHLIKREVLRKGMGSKEWHLTFQEFHDVLDRGR